MDSSYKVSQVLTHLQMIRVWTEHIARKGNVWVDSLNDMGRYAQEAIDLIEAQRALIGAGESAHLLTLEETVATQGASPVWVERPSDEPPVISLYVYESSEGFAFVDPENFNIEYRKDFFNRSWRVWDRLPTDAEREAAAWLSS